MLARQRCAGFPPLFNCCSPFLRQWGRRIPWLSLEVNGISFLWDRVSHCTVWSCVSQQGLVIICIHMQWRVIPRAFSQASRIASGQELASRAASYCVWASHRFQTITQAHTLPLEICECWRIFCCQIWLLPFPLMFHQRWNNLYVPSVLWRVCHVLGFSLLYCFMTLWQDK